MGAAMWRCGSDSRASGRNLHPMDLTDVDHKLLTWLRSLGSEPHYTYKTNSRSYDQAARKAVEDLGLAPDVALTHLKALSDEGLVEIASDPRYSSLYWARITGEGLQALRQPVCTDAGEPIVFVSCGQTSDEEIELGAAIVKIINDETPAKAYFADNQSTFEGVSTHILGRLSRCVGFVGIMHYRGEVHAPDGTTYQRASVWIEQEIAIASYRIHTLNEDIPVQLYIQKGIKREGLRDKVLLNPKVFETNEEVVEHFRSIVKGRFGALQAAAPTDLQTVSPLGERQRRVTLERPSVNPDFDLRLEIEPQQYRKVAATLDGELQALIDSAIEHTEHSPDRTTLLHEHLVATPTAQSVWLHGTTPPQQMGQRPPTPNQEIEFYADGAFILKFAQEDADLLNQAFRLMSNAYWIIRKVYPLLGIPTKVRAKLNFNLHAGRTNYEPVLHGGEWKADVDASQPFPEAFAGLTLGFTRAAMQNWTVEQTEGRLRSYWAHYMPAEV